MAFYCYLYEPFPATLDNDFNVLLDTVVFAHENGNAVLPVTLEQCWAERLMSEKVKSKTIQAESNKPSGYIPRTYII